VNRVINSVIKKRNQPDNISKLEAQEIIKCASDPIYFIENFVKIQSPDPTIGSTLFKLRKYQKRVLKGVHKNNECCVLQSRQSGKTITIIAYIMWLMCFHSDIIVGVASNKMTNAKDLISRFRYAYESLPYFMKPAVISYNKFDVEFDNGSKIMSAATTENTFRGFPLSFLLLDEFAFVHPRIADDFWTSILPTLSAGGGNSKIVITSTPNGSEGIFPEIWFGAEQKRNGFKAIRVHEREVPRQKGFKKKMLKKMSMDRYKQEFLCVGYDTIINVDGNDIEIGKFYDAIANKTSPNIKCVMNQKIKTPFGYENFDGIIKTKHQEHLEILFSDGVKIKCSKKHRFLVADGTFKSPNEFSDNETLVSYNGYVNVVSIELIKKEVFLYDIVNSGKKHNYYTNGVVSHNCEFISSSGTLIRSTILETLKTKSPIEIIGDLKLFKEIRNRRLGIGIDVGTGIGKDYSVMQIFDIDTLEQIGEYHNNNLTITDFTKKIIDIFKFLDEREATEIYYTVESNSIGQGVIVLLDNSTNEILNSVNMINDGRKKQKGMLTTVKTKVSGALRFKDLVESNKMKINSKSLISECKFFVKSGSSFRAESGMTDDLVMATVVFVNMLQRLSMFDDGVFEAITNLESDDGGRTPPRPFIV